MRGGRRSDGFECRSMIHANLRSVKHWEKISKVSQRLCCGEFRRFSEIVSRKRVLKSGKTGPEDWHVHVRACLPVTRSELYVICNEAHRAGAGGFCDLSCSCGEHFLQGERPPPLVSEGRPAGLTFLQSPAAHTAVLNLADREARGITSRVDSAVSLAPPQS